MQLLKEDRAQRETQFMDAVEQAMQICRVSITIYERIDINAGQKSSVYVFGCRAND